MTRKTTPRKLAGRIGAVALSAALLGAMPVATAGAADAQTQATSAAVAKSGAASTAGARPPAAPRGADPFPECSDTVQSACWDYRSWYWTYASCQDEGRAYVGGQNQYDKYVCAGDHGAVVWLWLHKP